MPVFLDITPIRFNGSIFCRMELTGSAMKHYESDSGKYYEYIFDSLDGQNRHIAEYGDDKRPIFKIGSCTSAVDVPAQSKYRETCFKTFPESQTVQFFHGCSIRKKQFEKLPDYTKVRIE